MITYWIATLYWYSCNTIVFFLPTHECKKVVIQYHYLKSSLDSIDNCSHLKYRMINDES